MKQLLVFFVAVSLLIACDNPEVPECPGNASCAQPIESLKQELAKLRTELIVLAQETNCNESSQCLYTGLGSKPCGGPWSYLIYSYAADTAEINFRVVQYNALEAQINQRLGLGSDCSVPNPPDSLTCVSGKCVAYFQGKQFTENECCNE